MLLTLVIKIGIAAVLLAALATFMIAAIVCAELSIRDAIARRRQRHAAQPDLSDETLERYVSEWGRQNS